MLRAVWRRQQCRAGGLCTRADQGGEGGGEIEVGGEEARGGDQGGEAGSKQITQGAHFTASPVEPNPPSSYICNLRQPTPRSRASA